VNHIINRYGYSACVKSESNVYKKPPIPIDLEAYILFYSLVLFEATITKRDIIIASGTNTLSAIEPGGVADG
jgi:hypothetical protein